MDSFINALNTTLLKSLNINKADSEIDEFDEVDVIDEHEENEHEDEDKSGTNSNEETIKPDKNFQQIDEENNYKSLANMTLGTLSATRKMQDRIRILERYYPFFK